MSNDEERSPHHHQSLAQRMQDKTCFHCQKQGHWVRDCPMKTPKKPPSLSSAIVKVTHSPPSIQCPCGAGVCIIWTSHTAKNPDRKFYKCPGATKCKFFRWCDELTNEEISPSPKFLQPLCPCGAGTCRRLTLQEGPNAGRTCFVCRIRRGFGACAFFHWEDIQVGTIPIELGDENRGCSFPQPKGFDDIHVFHSVNEKDLCNSSNLTNEHQERRDFSSPVVDDAPHSSTIEMRNVESQKHDGEAKALLMEKDKVLLMESQKHDQGSDSKSRNLRKEKLSPDSTNGDLVLEEGEQWYLMMKEGRPLPGLISPCAIFGRQEDFWRQISAADDGQTEGNQILSLHFLGWLGRLAFSPSRCLTEPPPRPIFCCVFPSFDRITVHQDVLFDVEEPAFFPSSQTHQEDASPLGGAVLGPVRCKRSSSTIRNDVLKAFERTAMHLKHEIATIFDSMDVFDQSDMSWAARAIHTALESLLIGHGPLVEHESGFVHCASGHAESEASIQNVLPLQEFNEQYNAKKVQFDGISDSHSEPLAALVASNKLFKSLNEKVSCFKKMILEIEKQLTCYEAETSELETRFT